MHLKAIGRNIFSNWAGYLITSVIGFLLSPFIVHHLGNSGYGVWTLVISLTGYFGLLDLGIRSSVGRFVARYLALDDVAAVNRTVSTAFTLLAGGGVLAVAATAAMYFTLDAFKIDASYQAAAKTALVIAGLNISVALPVGVFSAVLVSLDRFDVLTAITVIGALIRTAMVVVVLNRGYGLVALATVSAAASAVEYSATIISAKRLYRPLRLAPELVSRDILKELFSFGIYRFIWIIANQLIFYTDSIVISVFLNAAAVTYYAIAGNVITYGRTIVSLATDTLYPTAARLDSRGDRAGLQRLLLLGTTMSLLIAFPLCLGFVFLGKQFITLWMGKEYVSSAVILAVLTIPQVTSMSQYTSALILAAMAKHRVLAGVAVCEGVANLFLSVVLVHKIGLMGVAIGTVIPHIIVTTCILPLYTLNILGMRVSDYVATAYARPLLCAAPTAMLCWLFSSRSGRPSWGMFMFEGAAISASFAIVAYLFCLTRAQRKVLLERVREAVQKEPVAHEA